MRWRRLKRTRITSCDFLFNPERAARIVEFHARHGVEFPTLDDVFEKILAETFRATAQSGYEGEIQRTVNAVVLNELMTLAANERASNQVRAIAELKLDELKTWAASQSGADPRSKSTRVSALHRESNQALSGRSEEDEPHASKRSAGWTTDWHGLVGNVGA